MSLCVLVTQRYGWILNTGGVTTTNKYLQAELCHSCELQSTLRQSVSCSLYPQSRCQVGIQRYGWILNTGGVTTTNKYLSAELCHSCELQSTLRQSVSCSLYPQSRCVFVPTGDPMLWVDLGHWGCDHD